MKLWKKTRQVGESVLLLLGLATIPFLPRRAVVFLAACSGAAAYRLCRGLRRIALANLDLAYGAKIDAVRKEQIARDSFRTFALVALDLFWFSVFSKRRLPKYVEFHESFMALAQCSESLVAVTAHLGNWEILGQALATSGRRVVSVATPLKNGFADGIVNRIRRAAGQFIQPREGALKQLLRELRDGACVALVVDQNTPPHEGGIFIEFFGLPVPVTKAPAFLTLRSPSKLTTIGYSVPLKGGHYKAFATPIGPLKATTVEEGTREISDVLENIIRAHPGNWLWMYKRWKYIPEGACADAYPFYAKT
jgi:KDO2-lipid IV(A) lauroyltransferase